MARKLSRRQRAARLLKGRQLREVVDRQAAKPGGLDWRHGRGRMWPIVRYQRADLLPKGMRGGR